MKAIRWIAIILFTLLVGVMLWVLVLHWGSFDENTRLTEEVQEQAPGHFVELEAGLTHYQTFGSPGAPVVVLVHGFSIPASVWGETGAHLAAEGFYVIQYDLFGRGYSARPDVPYVGSLFEAQLIGLLDSLSIQQPVHVVGLSMGGAVTARTVAHQPERFKSMSLVAPLHQPVPPLGIPAGLGYYMLSAFYVPAIAKSLEENNFSESTQHALQESYQQQKQIRGFTRALTSSLYHFSPDNHPQYYREVAAAGVPVWLAWGTADTTVPFSQNEAVRRDANVSDQNFVVFEGAGHTPHLEQAFPFNSALTAFLKSL